MNQVINQSSLVAAKYQFSIKSLVNNLSLYLAKKNQRKKLLKLEPHLLKDIGVSRMQALDEAKK